MGSMTVSWCQWDGTASRVGRGRMPAEDIPKKLRRNCEEARELLKSSGADHVLYGMAIYDKEKPVAFQFYMLPMNQKQFDFVANRCRCGMVYALHRR